MMPNSKDQSNGKLRILRVSSDIHPEVPGGLGIHVHRLSKDQAELGHKVTVLTSDHGDKTLPREEQRAGYRLKRHHEVASPVNNSLAPSIAESLRNLHDQYDIIHAHSHLFFSSNIAAVMSQFSNTPLVITNHGLFSQSAGRWVQKIYLRSLGRLTFNAAERVLCYSKIDHDRLTDYGVTTPVSIVHNGIDCTTFKPQNSVTSQRELLFVGRLKPGKGVQYLIDAFSELIDSYPNLTLRIVGDGELRDDLTRYTEKRSITDRVSFTGWVPQERLPKLYNQATVFVLPSLSEGFPRTVLEALACETPVVTTALPQLESVLDGVGLTVPQKSSSRITAAIRELLEDKSRRQRMGTSGRKLVKSQYSWDQTVRKTTDVYHELVEGSSDTKMPVPTSKQ